jgi:hypothetical protein
VGVISSFLKKRKKQKRGIEGGERGPAMRATMSASSSRPWALAGW